jgi:Uma2 family endonuclease
MSTATPAKVYTTADLLAMPDDGVERWIIRGQLREKPPEIPGVTMTVRNRTHSEVMMTIGYVIKSWLRTRPEPRGKVYGGEAGVRLRGTADSTVGVDIVFASAELVAAQPDDGTTLLDGVPTLVGEILSPNDTQEQIEEKIDTYLGAGVPIVWIVNPYRRTVAVHRPGHEPDTYNRTQTLPQYPEMPGFAPTVAELFE